MSKTNLPKLRRQLLTVKGIGPETADSILLYACKKPVFVIDAYTRRILERHHLMDGNRQYAEVQDIFRRHLCPDTRCFNEFHALLVRLGKDFCRKKPLCGRCPLKEV